MLNNSNIYFQLESRFGLSARNGKSLTLKGVKPVSPFIQDFKNKYLFGAFSPIDLTVLLIQRKATLNSIFWLG